MEFMQITLMRYFLDSPHDFYKMEMSIIIKKYNDRHVSFGLYYPGIFQRLELTPMWLKRMLNQKRTFTSVTILRTIQRITI